MKKCFSISYFKLLLSIFYPYAIFFIKENFPIRYIMFRKYLILLAINIFPFGREYVIWLISYLKCRQMCNLWHMETGCCFCPQRNVMSLNCSFLKSHLNKDHWIVDCEYFFPALSSVPRASNSKREGKYVVKEPLKLPQF